uniref:B30.2/SPRY domain-containing protein n=1 Tax=Globodera rostochiensis TaxID=31243 RepID=A0A914H4S1_GLORO
MGTVLYLAAICFVVAAIQLKTDASPPETSNENPGLTPDNQWNSSVRHWQLTLSEREQLPDDATDSKRKKLSDATDSKRKKLSDATDSKRKKLSDATDSKRKKLSDATHSEPKKLVVEYTGEGRNLECSVFAVRRIPTYGIFYYEVKIERKKGGKVFIGLATSQMEVNEAVGPAKNTYAYDSSGFILGHEVEGCFHSNNRPYITKGILPFKDGNVVGCGVDFENEQFFYTLNGEIVIAGLSVDASLLLLPCVSLTNKGQKIEANFGPDFLFKLEKLKNLKN